MGIGPFNINFPSLPQQAKNITQAGDVINKIIERVDGVVTALEYNKYYITNFILGFFGKSTTKEVDVTVMTSKTNDPNPKVIDTKK